VTILNLVRNFFTKASVTMAKLQDTHGFADLMRAYAETTDEVSGGGGSGGSSSSSSSRLPPNQHVAFPSPPLR